MLRRLMQALGLLLLARSASAQVVVHTFTTATNSTPTSFAGCGNVTARCDQSVDDASTDASAEIRACASASDSWQDCTLLRTCPGNLPDATDVSIGAPPSAKPYLMTRVSGAPSSDTGRTILACAADATFSERGCRVVAFSTTGTYGPYNVYGSTLRFDLDGNASNSSLTTGATATVQGCTDFGSLSRCSCDMVGGDTACAVYDGTTGAAGFHVTAPRTVTVTVTSAAQAGTFTLCSW